MKASICLSVALVAVLLLSPSAVDAADVPGFRATYEDLSQEELVSLLGETYVGMVSREVLETAGINASEDSPIDVSKTVFSDADYGLDYASSFRDGNDGKSMGVSAHYSFYLDYSFSLACVVGSGGFDAFDEDVCGGAFGFEEYLDGDVVRIRGEVSIAADTDMRDTVVRQSYDQDLCAVDSTTLIGTFSCVFHMAVETVHGGIPGEVEIVGHKDVGVVTVVDYIYRSEPDEVRIGDEVFCIWTSREDSADVKVEFEGLESRTYVRDVGDCESGTSHGAVSALFFFDASRDGRIDDYSDAVSKGIGEFVRGETVYTRLSDDGLDPFREPIREAAGIWIPVASLLGALAFIFIAIRCMHEGMFRYRRREIPSIRPCAG